MRLSHYLLIFTTAWSCSQIDQPASKADMPDFYFGADLSYVNQMEDCGATYLEDGVQIDPYKLFAEHGCNLVRVRLWHNPFGVDYYSGLEDVTETIRRAKGEGMQVLLDFHYSDTWVDPKRQWRPRAWNHINDDELLADSLYNYTMKVLSELQRKGLTPEIVQIGNETNGNMLIEVTTDDLRENTKGRNHPVDWARSQLIFDHGFQAVRDFNARYGENTKSLVHFAQPDNALRWFSKADSAGIKAYDYIGLSYYPKWSKMNLREAAEVMKTLRETYQKEVMVVEVSYPWVGTWDLMETRSEHHTASGQREFMEEFAFLAKKAGASGLIFWEPAFVNTNCPTLWGIGSKRVNQIYFDSTGNVHEGIDWMQYDLEKMPEGLQSKEVTFRIDLSVIKEIDSVFIVGSFSKEKLLMSEVREGLYELKIEIEGRSTGEFSFYNGLQSEPLDTDCIKSRKYVVSNEPVLISSIWGECDQNVERSAD